MGEWDGAGSGRWAAVAPEREGAASVIAVASTDPSAGDGTGGLRRMSLSPRSVRAGGMPPPLDRTRGLR